MSETKNGVLEFTIATKVTKEVKEWIELQAAEEDMTISEMVRIIIECSIDKTCKEDGKLEVPAEVKNPKKKSGGSWYDPYY